MFDASNAQCLVFTRKEGVLSAIAHDLKLRVERFEISFDEGSGAVEASFDTASLCVVCAIKDGGDAPGTLRDKDHKKIARNIREDVLHASRHPKATFKGQRADDGDGFTVEGTLTLHGVERPLRATVVRDGADLTTEVTLHQPDFGIKPYSAMLGALKVQPDVCVTLRVPAP